MRSGTRCRQGRRIASSPLSISSTALTLVAARLACCSGTNLCTISAATTPTTQPITFHQSQARSVASGAPDHGRFSDQRAEEGGGAADALRVEGEEEDRQDRSVEERAEFVDRFDERAEAVGEFGEGDGEEAPGDRRQFREAHAFGVGRVRLAEAAEDVDDGGRGERVEAGRRRRHRRAEDRRQHQSDHAGGQVVDDEGQEDVVRVAVVGARLRAVDQRRGGGAGGGLALLHVAQRGGGGRRSRRRRARASR